MFSRVFPPTASLPPRFFASVKTDMPPRRIPPFAAFVQENKGKSMRELSDMFRQLPVADRERLNEPLKLFNEWKMQNPEAYREALEEAKMDRAEKAKKREKAILKQLKKETGRPTRPRNAYFIFAATMEKYQNETVTEFASRVSTAYQALSDGEKNACRASAAEELTEYHKALNEWEEKQLRSGNEMLVRSITRNKSAKKL